MKPLTAYLAGLTLLITVTAAAANAYVRIYEEGDARIIESNGIPDHQPGRFPNRGNPNTISEQHYRFQMPLNPWPSGRITSAAGWVFGVAVNGVPFDPGTAEFYNNDRRSGWNYEALSGKINLGLDASNAHVQPTGAYHYHGIPTPMQNRQKLIAYAADGFPVYISDTLRPSYRLKSGTRPSGPGGRYDGTFTEDYEYVPGLGDLDECNGLTGPTADYPAGIYHYVLTKDFPHVPRCFKGTPDTSFRHQGGGQGGPGGGMNRGGANDRQQPGTSSMGRPPGAGGQPPAEAVNACRSKSAGASCAFTAPHGRITGTCDNLGGTVACRPAGGPPGR